MTHTMNKEELVSQLREGIVTISFTKADGTERVMRSTLKVDFLPAPFESTRPKKDNPNVLNVWSVDDVGWRSVIIENIKEITNG